MQGTSWRAYRKERRKEFLRMNKIEVSSPIVILTYTHVRVHALSLRWREWGADGESNCDSTFVQYSMGKLPFFSCGWLWSWLCVWVIFFFVFWLEKGLWIRFCALVWGFPHCGVALVGANKYLQIQKVSFGRPVGWLRCSGPDSWLSPRWMLPHVSSLDKRTTDKGRSVTPHLRVAAPKSQTLLGSIRTFIGVSG